ncbi:hypothetical protein Tco_0730885 [Tanacetum coccineum]
MKYLEHKRGKGYTTSGLTSLGVTSEEGSHLHLSSGMAASNLNKPIFLASFIIYSKSASGRDASTNSTAKADPRKSAPHDSIPQQQGRNERTKNYTLDHIFADLDSSADDLIIVVDESEEDKEDKDGEINADLNVETKDTSVPKPPSPSPPKSSSQTEGEHIKIDKGKKTVSSKDAEEESSNSIFDDIINLTGSRVESLRMKKLNKFDFITEYGDHVHLTEDKIQEQKRIEESVKAEAAKHEVEVRKEELVDLLGPDVVSTYYKYKLQYDKYYDKMLNRRAKFRITNCNVLTRKGPISLKVYIEDSTSEVIPNFKASDLHLGEWREVMKACPNKKGKG